MKLHTQLSCGLGNHRPILYCLRDKWQFLSKISNSPVYFAPLPKGFPFELGIGTGSQKKMMGYTRPRKKFDNILTVWIQYTMGVCRIFFHGRATGDPRPKGLRHGGAWACGCLGFKPTSYGVWGSVVSSTSRVRDGDLCIIFDHWRLRFCP